MPDNTSGPRTTSASHTTRSLAEYRDLYKQAKPGQLRGDVSPDYLYFYQNAVPKILKEINAQIPIIIVLRNPIDRTYSNYLHKVRESLEVLSFEDALDAEAKRRAANWVWGWFYVDCGLYAKQVKAYLDNLDFHERVLNSFCLKKISQRARVVASNRPGGAPGVGWRRCGARSGASPGCRTARHRAVAAGH